MIFNWELADQNHYRNGKVCTVEEGHALVPGEFHSIAVAQEGEDAVVTVDDKEVYRTRAKLEGTVTVYPALGSAIGISEITIEGEADPKRMIFGHSHSSLF